ncbi:hypothetical protein NDU88_000780 [Pleurodeles waltl]|uniref:Secreted protein n=1 Tax=Pleurodeles waltl TaxID=8319 RepID=A0AAV7VXK5_PLEWA|nr:hypothetical protein NDU88_000780 [Pleurodeles waltl]
MGLICNTALSGRRSRRPASRSSLTVIVTLSSILRAAEAVQSQLQLSSAAPGGALQQQVPFCGWRNASCRTSGSRGLSVFVVAKATEVDARSR